MMMQNYLIIVYFCNLLQKGYRLQKEYYENAYRRDLWSGEDGDT